MTRGTTDTLLLAMEEPVERERLAGILCKAGHEVRTACDVDDTLESYRRDPVACVVTDQELPGGGGEHLTTMLRDADGDAIVIVLSAHAGVAETVDLMKRGVFHVLRQPVQPEELQVVVAKGLEHGRLCRGNRELQQQVDINEKLAMIGRLASGVAHELNNPLDGVSRYVRMTQEGLSDENSELSEYLDRAMSGLTRMTSIVRQLLTFSRNITIENERENLRTMLDEVVRTLTPSGSHAAVIDLDARYLDIPVPRVLFQVFVNLIKNALDAVEPRAARGLVRVEVRSEGEDILVLVSDNGTGIAEKDLRRVFEPFFTTKEVGKGTGLGLPISARIVERCGGKLLIESNAGEGTTVTVALPKTATAPAARGRQGAQKA